MNALEWFGGAIPPERLTVFSSPQVSCFPWWWSCTSSGSRQCLTWKATEPRKWKTAGSSRLLFCTAGRFSWPRLEYSSLCSLGYSFLLLGGISRRITKPLPLRFFRRCFTVPHSPCAFCVSNGSCRKLVDVHLELLFLNESFYLWFLLMRKAFDFSRTQSCLCWRGASSPGSR